ncbi:GLPGLI family protein [Winogradskyella sediminis]|uniref:GLPGLI family protein n=1 Tax=Winogradskyella sediminis TaxID=1382466 RepID=A0A1H1SGH7_9FLAO|nr:GLPGLI family protein [Winogradskyella sediminis]SDS47105.1 GLPGLI family protein [Winogradskyella sediminis]
MKYLIILFSSFAFAQNGISIEYLSEINRDNKESSEKEVYVLDNFDEKSIYKPKISNNIKKYVNASSLEKKWYSKKQNITAYKLSSTNTVYSTDKIVYKDLANNELFTNRILITSRAITDESDIDFNWDIVTNKDSVSVLGYNCQKAFTNFRGRTYVAYFTSKLPFPDGPYKFKGLPGMILKVESTDGYYKLEAVNINLNKSKDASLENPFSEEKVLTLDKYKSITKETLIKRLKSSKSVVNSDDDEGPIVIKFTDQLENIGMGVIRVD